MEIFNQKYICTIGTFDGVHQGHRYLLKQLDDLASETGLTPLVITFSGHPLDVIAPDKAPREICSADRKVSQLKSWGYEVLQLEFQSVADLTAAQFLRVLADMNVKALLMGYDNRFGSDKLKSIEQYSDIAAKEGISVFRALELHVDGLPPVTSTSLRRAIAAGDMHLACTLAGRPYALGGTVTHGKGIGHTIGFPTANLRPDNPRQLLPADGVYVATAFFNNVSKTAMVNIGTRPTVDSNSERTIEAHVIDYRGEDFYGKPMELVFIKRMRDIVKFESVGTLVAQLKKDAIQARMIDAQSDKYNPRSLF